MSRIKFKKLEKKDYGRIALLGLLLAGINSALQISLPPVISILIDILITAGFIAGVIWIVKTLNKKSILKNSPCERCGDTRETSIYGAQSTDTTRDYQKLFNNFPFNKPKKLCFKCFLAHEAFFREIIMLSIEKNQKFGRSQQIEELEKKFGDKAINMLALLDLANNDIDSARRVLDEESFLKIRPWIDEQIRASADKIM